MLDIHIGVYPNESRATWESFLLSLKKRGLHGLRLLTSDAHDGILHAVSRVFPEVPWQRCQTHFSRNILENAPKQYQAAIRDQLQELYNCDTLEQARRKRDDIIAEYQDVAEKSISNLSATSCKLM